MVENKFFEHLPVKQSKHLTESLGGAMIKPSACL